MVRRLVSYEYSPSAKVRLTCGGRTFRTSLFLSDGYCVLCRRSRVHGRARLSPVSAWSAPLALQAGAEWLRCVTSESLLFPLACAAHGLAIPRCRRACSPLWVVGAGVRRSCRPTRSVSCLHALLVIVSWCSSSGAETGSRAPQSAVCPVQFIGRNCG